jgi:O-antigen ligase
MAAPVLAFTAALLVSRFAAVSDQHASWRLLVWVGYLAVFAIGRALPLMGTAIVWSIGYLVALWSLTEFFLIGGRVRLLFDNPVPTSSVLLLSSSLMGRVGGGLALAGLLTTGTRGAVTGWLATFIAQLDGWRRRLLWLGLALLLIAIMLPWRPTNRLAIWRDGGRIFLERPLLGAGPGNYRMVTALPYVHGHNTFLTVAVESGVLGLAAWIWLVWTVVRQVSRSAHPAKWGLLAWGVQQLVDDTFWCYWVGIVVMLLLSNACSSSGRSRGRRERDCDKSGAMVYLPRSEAILGG